MNQQTRSDRVEVAALALLVLFGISLLANNHWDGSVPGTQTARSKPPALVVPVITPEVSLQPSEALPQVHTYYVSPAGNDANNGSLAAPWRTIQKAANVVNPGDTVYVRAGVYGPYNNGNDVAVFTRSGTASAPITFKNYPGEAPVIETMVNGARKERGFYINQAAHLIISGFEIRGAKRAGIRITGGDFVTIEDNKVHDIRDTASVNTVVGGIMVLNDFSRANIIRRNEVYDTSRGIIVRNEGGVPIEGAVVEKNYIHDTHWWNASNVYDDKNADGVVCNTTVGMIVRQNVITHSGDDGIDCYDSDAAIIEQNTVFNSGDILSGSPAGANGDGNGIKVSTGGGGGHLITRNIAFNNERAGFDQDHVEAAAPGNTYYHNVSYGNGRNGFLLERTSATPNVLRNNIAFGNNQDNGNYTDIRISNSISTVQLDSNFNLWSDGAMPSGPGGSEGSSSISGNPLFINPTTLGINLNMNSPQFGFVPGFKLQNNSPAVDAGVIIESHHLGGSADMGAYESF